MKAACFFSIIIPSFNSAETIASALKSIEQQEFQDFEILIIDNISSDNTFQVVNSFVTLTDKVTWISERDEGIYDAMNKGIQEANGKWLYFLGSDDYITGPSILKLIAQEIEIHNVDVIYGNVLSTRFEGKYDGEFDSSKIFLKNICHQAIFLKNTVFKLTGKFNLNYPSLSDWDNNLKWFLSKRIKKKYVPIVVAVYADGGHSSRTTDIKFFVDKPFKFLSLGHSTYSRGKKLLYLRTQIRFAIIEKDFNKAFKFLMQTPYIFY